MNYAIIPIVAGILNEALKQVGLEKKYCPLINIAIGVIGGLIIDPSATGAVLGILSGAGAGGLYDIKNIIK